MLTTIAELAAILGRTESEIAAALTRGNFFAVDPISPEVATWLAEVFGFCESETAAAEMANLPAVVRCKIVAATPPNCWRMNDGN